VFRASRNPVFERLLLRCSQNLAGFWRRHDFLGIGGKDVLDEFALLRFAGNKNLAFESDVSHIQAELGFALIFVRAMTGVTILRQDRADITVKLDLIGRPERVERGTRGERNLKQHEKLTAGASRQNW